jgi:hypothetical protein
VTFFSILLDGPRVLRIQAPMEVRRARRVAIRPESSGEASPSAFCCKVRSDLQG